MSLNSFIKKMFLKMGVTLVRGDLKKENGAMRAQELPAELLENCKIYPNRQAVLPYLPKGGIIAEIGVAYGDFSEILIKELQPSKFFAIDAFLLVPGDEPWGKKELEKNNCSHEVYYKQKFAKQVEQGKVEVRAGFSWDVLATFPDAYFDYLYVDAGHRYDAIRKDIEICKKKIKPTGYIQFNDYTSFDPINLEAFGVHKAVNEFMIAENYEMVAFCMQGSHFCDVVVRKKMTKA